MPKEGIEATIMEIARQWQRDCLRGNVQATLSAYMAKYFDILAGVGWVGVLGRLRERFKDAGIPIARRSMGANVSRKHLSADLGAAAAKYAVKHDTAIAKLDRQMRDRHQIRPRLRKKPR